MRLGQAFLDGHVERRQQVARLVCHARIEPANGIGRELGEVRRDDAPRALENTCITKEPRHSIAALRE